METGGGAGADSGGRLGAEVVGEVDDVDRSGRPPRLDVLEGRIVKLMPEELVVEDEGVELIVVDAQGPLIG